MTTVRTRAPAQRTYTIEVASPMGKPVTLRVRGMTLGAAGAAQPKVFVPSALNGAIKTALEPTAQSRTAHIARVMPMGATVELPGPMQAMANAAQALPDALRGTLIRGAFALLGSRFAPLVLPTLTLAAALYPRQLGDASLPMPPRARDGEPDATTSTAFVPLAPQGLEHAEGFKPLNANDPKLYGPPASEFTRPPTPLIRVLPVTDTATPQRLEGGPRVDAPTVPGKAQWVSAVEDSLHLATARTPPDPIAQGGTKKEGLRFLDVEVTSTQVEIAQRHRRVEVPDKRLKLRFQTDNYGEGSISVRWPRPDDRKEVEVELEKDSRLPTRMAGEILAHALGYTHGFIPSQYLKLQVRDYDTDTPLSKDAVANVALWAMAMHGKQAKDFSSDNPIDAGLFYFESAFRATSYLFEKPTTVTGYPADGPGLEDPSLFLDLHPRGDTSHPNVQTLSAQDLMATIPPNSTADEVAAHNLKVSYVVTAPSGPHHLTELRLGSEETAHHELAQGSAAVSTAGVALLVYDPHWGQGGGFRVQRLVPFSQFLVRGGEAKRKAEAAFQAAKMDGDGRWFTAEKPVSIEPFAGLQVRREDSSAQPVHYEIRVPDARSPFFYKKKPSSKDQDRYEDLASLVIEPVISQSEELPLALVRNLHLGYEMFGFLPAFVGQALAAVQVRHAATGQGLPFAGLRISAEDFAEWTRGQPIDFIDGLTIYGIEKGLGEYSPEVPFVLQRETEWGDIEFTINPAVRTQR